MLTKYGKVLRKLKYDHGITQRDIANKLNYTHNYVSLIANGNRPVPVEMSYELYLYFELSDAELKDLREAEEGLLSPRKYKLTFNTKEIDNLRISSLELLYDNLPNMSDSQVEKLMLYISIKGCQKC